MRFDGGPRFPSYAAAVSMADFSYELPEAAIAQVPAEPRESARLLVDVGGEVAHRQVADLPGLVGPGDVLVVNDTKVLPARLHLRKPTGGAAEVLLLEPRGASWEALVRPGRRLPPGTVLQAADGTAVVEVGERVGDGRRLVRLLDDPERHGEVPLPPYITTPLADPDRYQTVYAANPGSVAAPTAGLHLSHGVLDGCRAAGAEIATVELVVGLDTFRPVTAERVEDHVMHSERYRVPPETSAACARARRVVAVGTTTVRALEAAAASGEAEGRTSLFITGDFPFRVVDVLLTNFHMPRSTLLVLLEAFCGPRWRSLYEVALREGYRFLSFGDAMLVDRRR
jgi:S-adenosylmethionine:tRNA ribosyltransferase-isomerase